MLQTSAESQTGGAGASSGVRVACATSTTLAVDIVDVPVARRGSGRVLHRRLNHGRQPRRERLAKRRAEFASRLDAYPARPKPARNRRVVDAVRFALALKDAAELGA